MNQTMKTLQIYEAKRNIKPTIFQPAYLSEYRIVSYVAGNGIGINQNVDMNLFDEIIQVKKIGKTIHAFGFRNLMPTYLILRK